MGAWTFLATGADGLGIMRCPEGHIHIQLKGGAFELRLDDARFLAFAQTISKAAAVVQLHRGPGALSLLPAVSSKSN